MLIELFKRDSSLPDPTLNVRDDEPLNPKNSLFILKITFNQENNPVRYFKVVREPEHGLEILLKKLNVNMETVSSIKSIKISQTKYNQWTQGDKASFTPKIITDRSDKISTALADGGWLGLNDTLSSLPLSQGSLLLALPAWAFLGITIGVMPVVMAVFYPIVQLIEYGAAFRRWPNRAEGLDIAANALLAAVKYGLVTLGWSLGSLALPAILNALGVAGGVFGGGPLGLVATHLVAAALAGFGGGLAFYGWHVTSRVFNHYFTSHLSASTRFPFLYLRINRNPNPGKLPWVDIFFKSIYKVFLPGFLAGMAWYGASLIPGGVALIPNIPAIASAVVGFVGAVVTVAFGSYVVPKLARKAMDLLGSVFAKKAIAPAHHDPRGGSQADIRGLLSPPQERREGDVLVREEEKKEEEKAEKNGDQPMQEEKREEQKEEDKKQEPEPEQKPEQEPESEPEQKPEQEQKEEQKEEPLNQGPNIKRT